MPSETARGGIGRLSTSSSPSLSTGGRAGGGANGGGDGADGDAALQSSSASVSSSSRPSLLSRLSLPLQLPLPLRSRNRNVVDFHIRCEEPHKKYSAGDFVRGAVVLVVVKPLRVTHLVVSLHGYVRVLKDPTSVAKAQSVTTLPPAGSSKKAQYQGNGLASLFQDEQVLSGEGRIEPGKYEFGFELAFPDKGLPSSIDFERGTISYTITATLTRPTTIAPTSTCDRKVTLQQQIDVGLISPPRPRTIFLEPISKRTRRKKQQSAVSEKASASVSQEINDLASEADSSVVTEESGRAGENHGERESNRGGSAPSDMYSEISGESGRSASTAMSSRLDFAQLSQVGSTLTSAAKQQVVDDKTITATIELLKGGCMPGDTVSVRVSVQHIKRVKSMTGVIVTLFRQGKIDMAPPASAFSLEGGIGAYSKRLQSEEAFPRSRTGLAGLSLSSTSSTSVFRKDLDQNAAPLIIDPATLHASVTVSVRLPDDAFPTIRGVPGDMISFKYQLEVIVDLGGRLSGQMLGVQSSSRFGSMGTGNADQATNSFAPQRGSNVADTSQLRRQKGVISVSLETIVGTLDSSRFRQSTKVSPRSRTIRIQGDEEEEDFIRPEMATSNGTQQPHRTGTVRQSSLQGHLPTVADEYDYTTPPPHPADGPLPPHDFSHTNGHHHSEAAPSYIPPPEMPDQNNMTEKERIRQAETRLLPSQPPGAGAGASSAAGPSTAPDEDNIYDAEDTPRVPPAEALVPSSEDVQAAPSAPTEDELAAGRPTEDKQELERRRLMEDASAPPEFPDDMGRLGEGSSQAATAPEPEPTAPVLDEDADDYPGYGAGAGPSGSSGREQLPAYER